MAMSPHVKAQIAELDTEIAVVQTRLVVLQRRRNSLLPISTLPREIVIDILKLVVQGAVHQAERRSDDTQPVRGPQELRALEWIWVTQCYAQWRDIAIGCPELWTHIWAVNLGIFRIFVERSKGRLISIDTFPGRVREIEYDGVHKLLAEIMPQVRTLNLCLGPSNRIGLWLSNLFAPELKVLRLYSIDTSSRSWMSVGTVKPTIMPKLRQLHVGHCIESDWDPLLPRHLPTVTSVAVTNLADTCMFSLLGRLHLPALQDLSIGWDMQEHHWNTTRQRSPLVFPNLRTLRLQNAFLSQVDFLHFPSIQQVVIKGIFLPETDSLGRDPWDERQSFDQLLKPLHNSTFLNDKPYQVFLTITHWLFMNVRDNEGRDILVLETFPPGWLYASHLVGLVESIGAKFCCIYIQCLDTGEDRPSIPTSLVYYLKDDPNVTSIRIHARALWDLLSLLTVMHEDFICFCNCSECQALRGESYPGLKTLIFDIQDYDIRTEKFPDLLINFLEERKRRGLFLQTLRLVRSDETIIPGEALHKLSRAVPNFVVEVSGTPIL